MLSSTERESFAVEFQPTLNRLVNAHYRPDIDVTEIRSAAHLGLALALNGYDPARGDLRARAVFFVYRYIMRAIAHELGRDSATKSNRRRLLMASIRRPEHLEDFATSDALRLHEVVPSAETVEGTVIERERRATIVAAMKTIRQTDLDALVGVACGKRQTELAQEQGVGPQRINIRLKRARTRLCNALAGTGYGVPAS